jgi:very-short-patch-repair endonuclease
MYLKATENLSTVAEHFGVSRGHIKQRLLEWGIDLKPRSEAYSSRMLRMSKKQRQQLTENARKAREKTLTPEAQAKKAKTRQANKTGMTEDAKLLCDSFWVLKPVPEMAIGPYNVDIAIPSLKVAIELDGGDWHLTGKTRARDAKKERLLRNRGWIILRISGSSERDYLVSVLDRVSATPL